MNANEQAVIEPPSIDEGKLEAANVHMMFRMSIFGIVSQTFVALGLGIYFWLAYDRIGALAFGGYFVLIGLVRTAVWLTYRRAGDVDSNPASWLLAAAVTMLASGIGWAAAALYFYDLDPLVTTTVVAAMGVSGVLLLAPSIQVMAAFNAPLFLALLYQLGTGGSLAELATAGLLTGVVLTVLLHAEQLRRAVRESLVVGFEKHRLVQALSLAKQEVEEVGEKLGAENRQRLRLEDELSGAKISAEAANMAKDEFLATMSHEIRTPLNGILPILDILRGTPLNDTQRDYLNTAFQSSKHLLTIIDDILDYSKIEAGKLALESVGINLRELLDSVVRLMTSSAERKGLKLKTQIDADVRLAMRGDPVRLKQVLTNLVSNAVKFTSDGTVTLTLSKRQEFPRETELLFTVRDTGIGMDKQTADRLFQPFSQADASTTRTYGGTGLGLAICKRLVEMMHGKVGVRSEQGRGSVFWFTVRLKKSLGDIQAGSRELAGSKALLATADRELARRLGIFADRWEVKLSTVVSLQEAANRIRSTADLGASWHFDNLILDEKLGKDMPSLASDIRRNPALAELGILMLNEAGELPDGLDELTRITARHRDASEGSLQDGLQRLLDGDEAGEASEDVARELGYEADEKLAETVSGTVLLVEDNPVNLHVAQKLLEVAGLKFEIARNGKIAMDQLKTHHTKFQAVIMDCMMPVMDGYAATRAWREHEESLNLPRMPIIAMTANAMAGDRQKCLEAGMDDYMAKPMNLAVLKRTLARWITEVDEAEVAVVAPSAQGSAATVEAPPAARPAPEPAAVAPAPEAARPAEPVIVDEEVLEDLKAIMGEDFPELVGVYLEDSPKAFKALVKAAEANDMGAMVTPAHSLKSTSANLGATGLADMARDIEHEARRGKLTQANRQIAAMLRLYKKVAMRLNKARAAS